MIASKMMLALSVAVAGLLLTGFLIAAGGEIEPNARDTPAEETVPEALEPAPTVFDMSGALPDTSVGVYGISLLHHAGTVPSGEAVDATVLLDFQPNLGPAAPSVSVCIGTDFGADSGSCKAYEGSSGEAVQLDATGLSGEPIVIETNYGAGSGTTFVLCVSVFDHHQPAPDYAAIVGGACHHPTVLDMSGALPDTSAGIVRISSPYHAGTVPSGEDDDATIVIDFQPHLGPAALDASVCIGTASVVQSPATDTCEAYEYSGGGAVQLDATGLSGQTIYIGTDYGSGSGTTYVLCATVFDFHLPPDGYTAIYDGRCHGPAAAGEDEERKQDPVVLAGTAQGAMLPDLTLAALAAIPVLTLTYAIYYWPLLKFVASRAALPILGYAKIGTDEVLNHETRDKLMQAIRAEPGITPPELHRLAGGGWSTVVYHLGVLEKNGLVSSLIDGRHKRFFSADSIDFGTRDELAVLKNARTKAAYDLVRAKPGIIQKSIARQLGIAPQSTSWHLRRLEQVGLLEYDRVGRKTHYYAKTAGSAGEP